MKRILFAAVTALGLHGLLFATKFPGLSETPSERPFPRVLSMRLMGIPHSRNNAVETKLSKASDARHRDRLTSPPKSPKKKLPVAAHKKPPVAENKIISRAATPPEEQKVPPQPVVKRTPRSELPKETRTPAESQIQSGSTPGDSTTILQEAMPLYRVNTPPLYPRRAREKGIEGTVLLDVRVDTEGRAREVHLATSSGSALLDRAALAAVENWLFDPARRGTKPVEKWVRIPIRFDLQSKTRPRR